MKNKIKFGICIIIIMLSISNRWTFAQFAAIGSSTNNSWQNTVSPAVGAMAIATGYPTGFNLPSAFVIDGNRTVPTTNYLFRTDGDQTLDNLWQMVTGSLNGTTEKGRIFTSQPWQYPSLNTDFNIKATQGSLFLYSVDANNNGYHVVIDSLNDYMGISNTPKVKPEVANGDIAVTAIGLGIMLNVPNGNNYYRITVDNTSKLNNEFIAKV